MAEWRLTITEDYQERWASQPQPSRGDLYRVLSLLTAMLGQWWKEG